MKKSYTIFLAIFSPFVIRHYTSTLCVYFNVF